MKSTQAGLWNLIPWNIVEQDFQHRANELIKWYESTAYKVTESDMWYKATNIFREVVHFLLANKEEIAISWTYGNKYPAYILIQWKPVKFTYDELLQICTIKVDNVLADRRPLEGPMDLTLPLSFAKLIEQIISIRKNPTK